MNHWWEIEIPDADAPPLVRAVAYYRHSAQDRRENSIPIQQNQVRAWAREHGIEIIRKFCDAGRSGLNSEGRPAFTEMMEEWIAKRNDFGYVLCLPFTTPRYRAAEAYTVGSGDMNGEHYGQNGWIV